MRFSHNAVLATALITSAATLVNGQESRPEKTRGAFGVTLQPFGSESAGARRAQVVRVAYYAPRTQPTKPAVQPDSEDASEEYSSPMTGSHPMVAGSRAVLRNGIAYPPSQAPQSVKNAMWAANALRRKPYVWGGGHRTFNDRGYDCSGTVSFALHYAGVLGTPMPSSDFCRYGERGRGRWITIFSRHGHTFAVIAGLRLDTTDLRRGGDVGPRWYVDDRNTGGFEARHPVGL